MRAFTYEALPGRVVFGAGVSRDKLAEEVGRLDAERVLLVATGQEKELAEELARPLGERLAGRFTGVRPHVPVEVAERARNAAREVGADCLLSVGGGSTTGTAKAVALETELPIVAVPTTYAGSEMTPVYGLTSGQRKRTGKSLKVLPKAVIYDPELTFSLPDFITGPSAMNAMAHCVEAFYAPGANPITSLMAEEGIRTLASGVPAAVSRPENLEGRTQTLYGAYLAGAAFAAAGGGIHHKICHVLGGAYDLPHAETHT
ncbi:MAG: maleylacetate reductase, partial [Actinomycetota bacterium]|nr:maleylacetate reductase [Actinomycetota bacterium]